MDDLYLAEFLDLAKTCSFQESAENMCISASSLSKHIQKMEKELGVPLFDRSTRTVSLSSYGQILVSYAQQIVSLTDAYRSAILHAAHAESSSLRIGFLPMLARFGILDVLGQFNEEHPEITVNLIETYRPEELLLEHKYDFVFVDPWGSRDPHISKLLYMTDHLSAIFPEEHLLATAESVRIEDLKQEQFLLQINSDGQNTITTQKFYDLCAAAGFVPKVRLTSRHISTLAEMVENGRGVAILNSSEIRGEKNFRYSVVDIVPKVPFDVYVSYVKSNIRTSAAQTFLAFIREHAVHKGI